MEKLATILSGNKPFYLHFQFSSITITRPPILKNTKDAVRYSICNTATVIVTMYSDTKHDHFLSDNIFLKITQASAPGTPE